MRKIIIASKHLICAVIVAFLFLCPSRCVLSKEAEKSQSQQTPEIKGYNYNLKDLLGKVEQNLKEVDKKLKEEEVKKQNEERDATIRKHFEKGNQLYQEGKFKEAKQQWQKALEISKDPEMKGYIKKAESRAKEEELARKKEEQKRQKQLRAEAKEKERVEREKQKQLIAEQKEQKRQLNEQAKTIYNEAVSLYRARNYQQAQAKFEQAIKLVPNYARTDNYLNRIPQDIKKEQEYKQREKELALKKEEQEKQKQLALQQKEKARLKKQLELEKREQQRKQKEEQAQLEKEKRDKELAQKRELEEKINSLYKQATIYYKNNQFDQAKNTFKEILSLNPDHRRAKDYLNKKIPNRIEQLEVAEQKEKERMQQAEQKRSDKQIQEKQETKKRVEAKPKKEELQLNEQAKTTYNEAVSLYRAKNYKQAQLKFNQVTKLIPNYARTASYLRRIPQDIQKEKERVEREKQKQLIAEQKEQKHQLNEQAKTIYNEAVSLYRARNYQQAQAKFEQISELIPNYAGTDSYLRHISQDIQKEKERLAIKKQQEEEVARKEQERKQKQEQAKLEKEQKEKQHLEAKKTQEEKLARAKEINSIHKKAIASYNQNQFEEASSLFKQILSLDPGNRRAKYYLEKHIPNRIKKIQETEKKQQEYKLKKEKAAEERKLKEEQRRLETEKRNAEREKEKTNDKIKEMLKRKEAEQQKQQKKQKQADKKQLEKIDRIYGKAVSLYKQDKLSEAKVLLFDILSLDLTESRALDYINNKIPSRIKELQK